MQLPLTTKLSLYTVAVISTFGTGVDALGINCRGSPLCSGWPSNTAQQLSNWIQQIPDNAWYNNGQKIACAAPTALGTNSICAFLQNTGGTNGAVLKQLSGYIPGHGCTKCGSVPYYFPQGNNNVADGELTFNYVSNIGNCNLNGACSINGVCNINGGLC